ncbi:MAG: PAS domain-containing sensor histidine kinase, partial [Candidatus Zixiibacteriota bacterium]
GQKLNGLLVLDRTLQPIRAEFYSSIKRAALVATLSILVMMLLFRWYIRKQVISRVAYLESLARRVVNNELDLDIKLSGTDELASLARSFNNMKGSLRLSIQEIERHRNYLTNLLNNLIDAILIIDDSNKVVFANKSLTTVLGPVFQSCQPGDKVDQLLQLSDQLTPIKKLIQQVRQQKEAAKGVVRLQLKSGTEKYLEVHVGHLVLPPQRKPEIIIVFRDITTVISFEKQMYQSEKLATLGRLAAGLAHEINNPMASILTCAEGLLKSGPNGSAEQREYLQIIKNSAQRCKMITQKLLDFSAGSNLRKELVDPLEVVKEAVSLLQFEASKRKVTVSIHCEKSIPTISGSRDALVQVFVNLILNSLQAIDDRGKVDIVMQADKSSVDITVKDNGIGISQDNLNHIFEPFFTTKTAGTGLGLSVSQGIIKQHHGQITIVESRPGRTSIKVTIPIAMSSQVSQV